jgi:hypothetical protein
MTKYTSQNPVTFREGSEDDVAQKFVDTLAEKMKKFYKQLEFPNKMIFTEADALIQCSKQLSYM